MRDIWIDFNTVDASGWVLSLMRFADNPERITVGARVLVGDEDGNRCEADVLEVTREGQVRLSVDMSTFEAVPVSLDANHFAGR